MKITVIEMENPNGTITEHVIIDRGDDGFTSMPKAIYDEQQAALANAKEL